LNIDVQEVAGGGLGRVTLFDQQLALHQPSVQLLVGVVLLLMLLLLLLLWL
jgi:hypothetical protein